jgi:oligoribonuclease NrnB/cAMP/cGMP phosphodiesterase (DHH superfamily)
MKCFYHDDMDGKAAAACVYTWLGPKPGFGSSFIPMAYGKDFPLDTVEKDEQVWIVDYSIEPDEMLALLRITKDVVWIDHHKTAIEKYQGFEKPINGFRKVGEAGCVLTFQYIHWYSERGGSNKVVQDTTKPNDRSLEIPTPSAILLVGDRDVWRWDFGEDSKNFHAGAQTYNTDPGSNFWTNCFSSSGFHYEVIERGSIIERFKREEDVFFNKNFGYDVTFHGYSCFACNRKVSSDRFDGRDGEYDMVIAYIHDGHKYAVTMYSQEVDVSEIAKIYGGGGHKGAAGFQAIELPFKPSKKGTEA